MSDNLQPGDLVTGYRGSAAFLVRPAGTVYWTMSLPQCCVMIVVEPPARRSVNQPLYVTVLAEDQLLEVFLNDVERLTGEDR